MAVIFFDGFENPLASAYWSGTNAEIDPNFNFGVRTGSQSLRINAATPPGVISLRNFGTHSAKKVYIGFGAYNPYTDAAAGATGLPFLSVFNSSLTNNLTINMASVAANQLRFVVRQSNTTVTNYTFTDSAYYYNANSCSYYGNGWLFLEFEFNLGTSPNTVAMRVNGSALSNSSSSQITNLPTTLGSIAGFDITGSSCSIMGFDDLYVSDNIAPAPTGYLGTNTQVHKVQLQSGASYVDGWREFYYGNYYTAPNFDGGTLLDDNNGDLSSVTTAQFNKSITYNAKNVSPVNPATAVIAAIRLDSFARKVSLDSAYKCLYYDGTTTYELGSKITLTDTNYAGPNSQIIKVNPATGANWTITDFNAASFGVKSVDPVS
jgi:hypothetical protein